MADKTIEGVELLVIESKPVDDKGRTARLRVVQWVIDGESKSVKLERRNFFTGESGDEMTGKADGFALRDLELCRPHWAKIMELMKNPPAVKIKAVEAAKEILGATEVPF